MSFVVRLQATTTPLKKRQWNFPDDQHFASPVCRTLLGGFFYFICGLLYLGRKRCTLKYVEQQILFQQLREQLF